MGEFAARIRRVRLKGGADLHIIHNEVAARGEEATRGALLRHAKSVVDMDEEDSALVGFVVVGIFDNGRTSVGYRYDPKSRGAVPRTLLPAWIAEIMRRDVISAAEAEDVFHTMFEWSEG